MMTEVKNNNNAGSVHLLFFILEDIDVIKAFFPYGNELFDTHVRFQVIPASRQDIHRYLHLPSFENLTDFHEYWARKLCLIPGVMDSIVVSSNGAQELTNPSDFQRGQTLLLLQEGVHGAQFKQILLHFNPRSQERLVGVLSQFREIIGRIK
jgi:hypothetical protein